MCLGMKALRLESTQIFTLCNSSNLYSFAICKTVIISVELSVSSGSLLSELWNLRVVVELQNL